MSNEHTPGPWRSPWRIHRPTLHVDCFEVFWRDDGDGVQSYTYVAATRRHDNARLIAAVPEFLSAARRLLDYFDSPDDHPDCIKDDVLIRLREVVEDATNPIAWKKEES